MKRKNTQEGELTEQERHIYEKGFEDGYAVARRNYQPKEK